MATIKLTMCALAVMVATASATACNSFPTDCTSSDCKACVAFKCGDKSHAALCTKCQYNGGSTCFDCVKYAATGNKEKCTYCNGDSLCTECLVKRDYIVKDDDLCLTCKYKGGSLCYQCLYNCRIDNTDEKLCGDCNGNSLCFDCLASKHVYKKEWCVPSRTDGCQSASDCIECLKKDSYAVKDEGNCIKCRTKGGSVCYNCVQSYKTDASKERQCVDANGDSVKINDIING